MGINTIQTSILTAAYKLTDGRYKSFTSVGDVAQELSLQPEEAWSWCRLMNDKGLLKIMTHSGGFHLTERGFSLAAGEAPVRSSMNTVIIGQMTNSQFQQGSHGSTQIQTNTNEDKTQLELLIPKLLEAITDSDISLERKQLAKANALLLQQQLSLPEQYRSPKLAELSWDALSKFNDVMAAAPLLLVTGRHLANYFGL